MAPRGRYVALLRAVNVGGSGKLPMADLAALCVSAGFEKVRTYIASGNVVFQASGSETRIKKTLEDALQAYAGKPVGVLVRTADEIQAVAIGNPFPEEPGNRVMAIFLDTPPPKDVLAGMRGQTTEALRLGTREIYVHYPDGLGRSALVIPAASGGTARNMNTVAKLADMALET